jgi:hypothetical protein
VSDLGGPLPSPEQNRAYAVVDAALREDPGFELSAGFADRATLRALQSKRGFDWFEQALVPLVLAAPILFLQSTLSSVMQRWLPGFGETLLRVFDVIPRLSIDGLVYAGASVLASSVADRLLKRRIAARAS